MSTRRPGSAGPTYSATNPHLKGNGHTKSCGMCGRFRIPGGGWMHKVRGWCCGSCAKQTKPAPSVRSRTDSTMIRTDPATLGLIPEGKSELLPPAGAPSSQGLAGEKT